MTHRVKRRSVPIPDLNEDMAQAVAQISQAFATPSRVRILVRLSQRALSVSALADDVGMEQSAVSHQLRILRDLRLVRAERAGRAIVYSLGDDHVATMLHEAIYHVEHVQLERTAALPTTDGTVGLAIPRKGQVRDVQ